MRNVLVLLVHVVVKYFLYLICICILSVVLTTTAEYFNHLGERTLHPTMPIWVSTNNCVHNAFMIFIGPILWGHSGPLCHALSLSLSLSSLSWTSMSACDGSGT